MKKKIWITCISVLLTFMLITAGCAEETSVNEGAFFINENEMEQSPDEDVIGITPAAGITQLENGFSAVRYDGDYKFDDFLAQGGAESDSAVVEYLADSMLSGLDIGELVGGMFGCSTISVTSSDGNALFGRNFDWENCEAMVVASYPENGYASISTVNMDFINQGAGSGIVGMALQQLDEVKTLAALYAPLDGMNEKGLAVSVNMIQDAATIDQQTEKVDVTTTTAVRLLLNQAANVDEALALLEQYDMHASMGMMVHFAIADTNGRSVVVEYIENAMTVTDTPVVTNFYLADGEKNGIGTQQSHERYEILTEIWENAQTMDETDVRDALDSVSKDNFGEFESTEWSAVFNQSTGEARYYHREQYDKAYVFNLEHE